MHVNIAFLPALGAAFMLMFARIGTMVMLLPGLGESGIPSQIRLAIALVLCFVLFPLHRDAFAIDLRSFGPVTLGLGEELMIGAILGLTTRLTVAALQVAGSIIAQQLGLGFVTAVDPTQGEQGVIVGNFLAMLGTALVFTTDLHYLVIAALHESYQLFPPGDVPLTGDVAALFAHTAAGLFRIGVQLSAPFLMFGLLFNVGLGVLARLIPQMQVYFIGVPLSILIGLLILYAVLGSMMGLFFDYAGGVLRNLAPST